VTRRGRITLLAVIAAVPVLIVGAYVLDTVGGSPPGAAGSAGAGDATRGEYVFHAAGCAACHTQKDGAGPPLAGGRALATPFGTFYSPNITPDREHGIGTWSADDLWHALHAGRGPGGAHFFPVFPYTSYAKMRREDSDALHAYLMSVPPQAVTNRAHDLPWFLRWRIAAWTWQRLFLDATPFVPAAGKSEQWNRGAYLVAALGHCGECHTPRNLAGAIDRGAHLAGNPDGPDGDPVPSIRSDTGGGIESWSENEIVEYLKSGMNPDFDFAGGAMVEVIEDNTRHLTDADRRAIAVYLKDLPPP